MQVGAARDSGAEPPGGALVRRKTGFPDLDGWAVDDHAAALEVFRATADLLVEPTWAEIVSAARSATPHTARAFFERAFCPVLIGEPADGRITGYYEPELPASRHRSQGFPCALHRPPPELPDDEPWATRVEIEEGDLLAGRGLEVAWVQTPLDRFFLQVQGSGRLRFPDGDTLRVGYAGRNGHPYRSVGQVLVRRGLIGADKISTEAIHRYVTSNPEEGALLLRENPSYVFFRPVTDLAESDGPLGTLGRPLTAGRSVAVDPAFIALGAPVWVEAAGRQPLRRLMIAQDTGSAIKGPQRADVFFGTGEAAGARAGTMNAPGRLIALWPKVAAL